MSEELKDGDDDDSGERRSEGAGAWKMFISRYREGDVVKGRVTRTVRGGLLVNIGVDAFLPASQVDAPRPADCSKWIDRDIECMILKIDEPRRAVVISRRALITR
jgi:small subunit ribosomal protein S1